MLQCVRAGSMGTHPAQPTAPEVNPVKALVFQGRDDV